MDEPVAAPPALLERLGWHPSDVAQIEVYASMAPERKVQLMLKWRGEQVRLLKERLEREHPNCSREELALMLQEHLDLVRESPRFG